MKGKVLFNKERKNSRFWWVERIPEEIGLLEISFDRKKIYNLFQDYPWKFSPEEKAAFDSEEPYWADFFKDRV